MDAVLRTLLSAEAEARVQVVVVVELGLSDQFQTAMVVPVPFASVPSLRWAVLPGVHRGCIESAVENL